MSALDHRTSAGDARSLPNGTSVSLREARPPDLDAIRALADAQGVVCDELGLARLVRADPRSWLVLTATAPADPGRVLGIGAIEVGDCASTIPLLLLVEPSTTGLAHLLAEALVAGARSRVA